MIEAKEKTVEYKCFKSSRLRKKIVVNEIFCKRFVRKKPIKKNLSLRKCFYFERFIF